MEDSIPIISDWRAVHRNTLVGTFTVTLPTGMQILGCLVHDNGQRRWIMLPGAPTIENGELRRGDNGKVVYKTIIRFGSLDAYRNFETSILEELEKLGHI